jgi:protein ImuB
MPAYACIFVPDFPVEALLRLEPDLRSQALAVLEGKPPLQKVFAMNERARAAGVAVGMTKVQLEACSDVVLRVRSPLQEDTANAALLDCAQSFSPRVEDTAPDTVLIDLAGMESIFGPLPKIAREIARRTSDLGIEANVAVAANPEAAALAARGFSGITLIPPGKEAEQLGSLPVETLFAGTADDESQFETLERWGIRNLRTLAALPEIALSERMGQAGVRLQKLACGSLSRTLVTVDVPLIFEEAAELEYPIVLLEPLAFFLSRMLEQLCARLGSRALSTQELTLRLTLATEWHNDENADLPSFRSHIPSSTFERTLRLPVPLLDAKIFLKLLQLDLKANPPGAPILKIYLSAQPVRPRAAQGGLFLPPLPEPEKLELTLARIAGIVGADKVGSLQILDTHRPEGFRMQRFAPAMPKYDNVKKADRQESAVTALRIFRPPAIAQVTLRDGKPARVQCPKRKEIDGEIIWTAGPWRASGDWWEQDAWSRDEWDIAVQGDSEIALYRLVRDLLNGKWMVEGTYD